MPKLPDALGVPDQATAAIQGFASEAAQPYDAIESVLDGAPSLYSRFGQGGPPNPAAVTSDNAPHSAEQAMDPTNPNLSDSGAYAIRLAARLYQCGLIGPSRSR